MGIVVHRCSPVWRTSCLGSPVRSDPEPQHLFFLSSFIVLIHIGKILVVSLGFAHGGHQQHVQPSVSRTIRKQCKLAGPLDHLDASSSCSIELMESPEEHTLSSFDEVGSQRVP